MAGNKSTQFAAKDDGTYIPIDGWTHEWQYSTPRRVCALNRYGFVVITEHWTKRSLDYRWCQVSIDPGYQQAWLHWEE